MADDAPGGLRDRITARLDFLRTVPRAAGRVDQSVVGP